MITPKSKNLKAQAAFEFLTTYGWAFLVILIMVGTLAYFGILTPRNVLPSRCNLGAELQCIDHQISATGSSFRIKLKNNAGSAIDVSSITLSTESTAAYTCTTPPAMPAGWQSGTIRDLEWTGCSGGGIVAGTKGKVLITIRYYATASGSNFARDVKGEVFSSVA